MILRRIKAHIEKENWFAVFIDFLIVVVGVFMGIQVANWNEEQENERIAIGYIKRVQSEILTEIKNSQNVLDYLTAARAHGIAALNAYKQPANQLSSGFLIDLYQASQTWNYQPNINTYNELLATGRISLITNENQRKSLSGYFLGRTAGAKTIDKSMNTAYRETIRSYLDSDIQRQIRKVCGDIYVRSENNTTYLQLPKSCEISINEDLILSEVKQLHVNDKVRRELTFHLGEIEVALASLKNDINAGHATLAILAGNTP